MEVLICRLSLGAGCIRQLVIQGEEVIFKDLDRSSTGVTSCPTCKDQPCQVSYFRFLHVPSCQAVQNASFLPRCLLERRSLRGLGEQPVQVQLPQRIHGQQLPASLIPPLSLRYTLPDLHKLAVTVCRGKTKLLNWQQQKCLEVVVKI